MTSSYTN
jgi:hypothetical protein